MKKWDDLPHEFKTDAVRPYYDALYKKRASLVLKRIFDIVVSLIMLIILSPAFIALAVAIKLDSSGPVFYRQVRVTTYGRRFRIFKFRSMVVDADKGFQVTAKEDARITKVGRVIRKYRLDEICQLIDVLRGTMTFVGTRPEVPKYVEQYTPQMLATLLMPAGVTSLASIYYKDEDKLLNAGEDMDKVYIEQILPGKMKWNLQGIKEFAFWLDIKIMFLTLRAMLSQ